VPPEGFEPSQSRV